MDNIVHQFFNTVTVIISLLVVGGSVCRVAMLNKKHQFFAHVAYIATGTFALGLCVDIISVGDAPSWYAITGTLIIGIHLLSTYKQWIVSPPKYLEKDSIYENK